LEEVEEKTWNIFGQLKRTSHNDQSTEPRGAAAVDAKSISTARLRRKRAEPGRGVQSGIGDSRTENGN